MPPEPPTAAVRALGWAFERAPAGMDGLFGFGRRYVLPLMRFRLAVVRLTGPVVVGGPTARLITVGEANSLGHLVDRFFAGTPTAEPLGSVTLGRLPGALDRLAAEADLLIACAPRAYAGWLGPGYLRVPALVDMRVALGADLPATLASASATVRYDARRAARFGYDWARSRAPADLERLYHEHYRPFVLRQFGPRAVVRDPSILRRALRRGGEVVWVRRHGREVAGTLTLVRGRGRELHLLVAGVAAMGASPEEGGGPSPQFVVNLAALHVAHAQGLAAVHLGGTKPSLRDGVFRAKRAWGAAVRPWEENHRELLLRWREPASAAVRHLLRDTPLLFGSPCGLWALTAAAGPDEARALWRQLAPPGLLGLAVLGGGEPGLPEDGPIRWCPDDAGPAELHRRAIARRP
jgi:hypothetical protein